MQEVYPFEEKVIDIILNTIKDNQEYLTLPENLPQLAKLGYMYNKLWYAGRVCWGYDGIIADSSKVEGEFDNPLYAQCEDNPKYKIEMCEPINDEIDNLIYDAWGMHVSNFENPTSWENFKKLILEGRELSELDKKMLKPNKTFDEWVEIMTNENYRYVGLFPSRRAVADYLLCTIGTGYGYKNGYIIQEASGADQDHTLYGDWENATFREDIQEIVNSILNNPKVQETVEEEYKYVSKIKEEQKRKEDERWEKLIGMPYEEYIKSKEYKKKEAKEDKHRPYYPICDYSIISKLDKKSHPSYIKAGIEICEDILANAEIYQKGDNFARPSNVSFAKKFIKKFNK